MSNNSDPLFDRYADLDFSTAKRVHDIPALAKLQAEQANTLQQVSIDNDVLETFRAIGIDWQANINTILRDWLKEHAA